MAYFLYIFYHLLNILQGNEYKEEWNRTNPMASYGGRMTDKINKHPIVLCERWDVSGTKSCWHLKRFSLGNDKILCFSLLRKSISQIRNLASIIKFFICSLVLLLRGESKEVRSRFWDVTLIKTWLQVAEAARSFIVPQSQIYHLSLACRTQGIRDFCWEFCITAKQIVLVSINLTTRLMQRCSPGPAAWDSQMLYLCIQEFLGFKFLFG